MKALARRVILGRGWPRRFLALASGAIGALAMPPFGVLPALVVSLTVAVWLLDGCTGPSRWISLRSAALTGWLWGLGYFVAGLWWLGAAFLVEADLFAWAMPLGVLGLPALLAFFPAIGFALARLFWSPGAARLFAFALGLSVSEWLRGHLFTGFPWNAPGMALGQHPWLMQTASLIGLHGMSALAILVAAAPALIGTAGSVRSRWLPTALAGLALAALSGIGALRLPAHAMPAVGGVFLRIMQPNLDQDAKFRLQNSEGILRHYITLSGGAGQDGSGLTGITHLIWPESAFPFLLQREPEALAKIGALLPSGTTLVTGAARMAEPLPGEEVGRFFNAIQVVADDGRIMDSYDKVHLVPFGEYVPRVAEALIRAVGLRAFVHIPGGFSPAERRLPLAVPGLPPVAATICYEAIFPGAVLPAGERPNLILNVTNDAWFGRTPGPFQHFAQARLRAVEEGLPLVRVANSGISAVVDPYGRVLGSLPLVTGGILDSRLPIALPETFYARHGDLVLAAMLLSCLALALRVRPARQAVLSGA